MLGSEFLTRLADLVPEYDNSVSAEQDRALRHANLVQDRLESEITGLNEDYFLVSATESTVSSQKRYSLPSDFLKPRYLEQVVDDTTDQTRRLSPLGGIDDKERVEGMDSHLSSGVVVNATGEPRWYVMGGDFFEVRPIPDAAYTLRLWYLKSLADIESGETMELPDVMVPALITGTAIREKLYRGHDVRALKVEFSEQVGLGLAGLAARLQDGPIRTRQLDHPQEYSV